MIIIQIKIFHIGGTDTHIHTLRGKQTCIHTNCWVSKITVILVIQATTNSTGILHEIMRVNEEVKCLKEQHILFHFWQHAVLEDG